MKKIVLIVGLLGSLLVSSNLFAAKVGHSSTITNLYPLYNGSVVLYLKDSNPSCKNAAGTVKRTFYLAVDQVGVTESGFKNIYSAALTAFTTGKRVWIYFDDSTGACYIDRIYVYQD